MKLHDYVSYPGHGIGQITELKTMNGTEFLSVNILDSGLKILIPKTSTDLFRPVMDADTARECRDLIREPSKYSPEYESHWKRRFDKMLAKLKSNHPMRISEVIAELKTRKADGEDLTFGERKMMDAAYALIAREIYVVLNEKII